MSAKRLVDVVVLGGHTGALTAACLLARRGYKVLHVDHDGLGGGYEDAGWHLPLGPELLPGPRTSPAIEKALEALALGADAGRLLRPVEPALQLLTPGRRFELHAEKSARARELVREFGEAEGSELHRTLEALLEADAAMAPFLAAGPPLPPDGLRERMAASKAARGVPLGADVPRPPREHVVGAAVAVLARLSTYLWTAEEQPLGAVRSAARLLHGLYRHGEAGNLVPGYGRMLRRRLEELGGESAGGGRAVAEEILMEGGRVAGVRLVGDATEYRCKHLVSGIDAAALRRLIPLEGRRRRYDSTLDSIRPRELLFTTHLVLDRRGWPPGLGEAALWLAGDGAALEEAGALVLQRFDAVGEDGPDPERVVLQASCFMSAAKRDLGDDYLEALQGKILDALRSDLLPFLDEHLVHLSSPYLARRGPARGARLAPHPLLETDLKPAFGVGVLAPRTPYKNLFLAGREVIPGLGLEGELLAGLRAAELVATAAHKHDPLKDQ